MERIIQVSGLGLQDCYWKITPTRKYSIFNITTQKWSFPLRISSVDVTKSAGNCGSGHFYWRNLDGNPYARFTTESLHVDENSDKLL